MKYFILIIPILTSLLSAEPGKKPSTYPAEITEWRVMDVPPKGGRKRRDFFDIAGTSPHCWNVTSRGNNTEAHLLHESPEKTPGPAFDTTEQVREFRIPATRVYKVADGWIAVYTPEDYAGAMYWLSDDGFQRKQLSDQRIHQMISANGRMFAVGGAEKPTGHGGTMMEITRQENKWTATQFVALPSAGVGIAACGKDEFVVATIDQVYRINLEREMLLLTTPDTWGRLKANSIAVGDGMIYVGLQQFVARLPLSRNMQEAAFLLPDKSWMEYRPRK